jgi:DNA uptake protein ComE-like DNA-binding protein
MKALLTRVRLVATYGILSFSLVFPAALPASAERPSDAGQLLLWLLGLNTAREQGAPRKIDVNSATVEELAAVPGLERRQAQRITVNRPYATLQDLARAGLSSRLIEHLTALLTVDPAKAMPSR